MLSTRRQVFRNQQSLRVSPCSHRTHVTCEGSLTIRDLLKGEIKVFEVVEVLSSNNLPTKAGYPSLALVSEQETITVRTYSLDLLSHGDLEIKHTPSTTVETGTQR